MVLLSHATGSRGFIGVSALPYLSPFADLGVTVFFVISGFLITGILLREIDKKGSINLFAFYMRRTLRIFPPFYAYLLVLFVLRLLERIDTPYVSFLFAAGYLHNYAWIPWDWLVGHTWSLAVEEQFYLLWPGALLLLGRQRGVNLLWALLLISPLLRTGFYYTGIMSPGVALNFGSHAAADALAIGCLLAFKRDWLLTYRPYQRFLHSRVFIAVPLVIIGVSLVQKDYPLFAGLLGKSVINLCIALSIDHAVTNFKGYAGTVLNSRPFVFVGLISYSLYLWQQPFLRHDYPGLIHAFPLNIVLTFACALVSYYTVERYSLILRRRMRSDGRF
jgi:peptidoglycan/LPS O-acetylase OafA/YrhL